MADSKEEGRQSVDTSYLTGLSVERLIAETVNRWAWYSDPYAIEIRRRLEAQNTDFSTALGIQGLQNRVTRLQEELNAARQAFKDYQDDANRILLLCQAECQQMRGLLQEVRAEAGTRTDTSISLKLYERISNLLQELAE